MDWFSLSSDRANAYDFWAMYPPSTGSFANYSTSNPILIKGGYLIRSVQISGSTLEITGDLNSTASFEIIAPAASSKQVTFNGKPLTLATTNYGTLTSSKTASLPSIQLPDLESLAWVRVYNYPRSASANESQRKRPTHSQKSSQLMSTHFGRQPTTLPPSTPLSRIHQLSSTPVTMDITLATSSGARTSRPPGPKLGSRSMCKEESRSATLYGSIRHSWALGSEML
jgi:hypothetical protein